MTCCRLLLNPFLCLLQAGRYEQALVEGYRKALDLEPQNEQYQKALSMAENKLQDNAAGASMVRTIIVVAAACFLAAGAVCLAVCGDLALGFGGSAEWTAM